jgi:hypothetical protein
LIELSRMSWTTRVLSISWRSLSVVTAVIFISNQSETRFIQIVANHYAQLCSVKIWSSEFREFLSKSLAGSGLQIAVNIGFTRDNIHLSRIYIFLVVSVTLVSQDQWWEIWIGLRNWQTNDIQVFFRNVTKWEPPVVRRIVPHSFMIGCRGISPH